MKQIAILIVVAIFASNCLAQTTKPATPMASIPSVADSKRAAAALIGSRVFGPAVVLKIDAASDGNYRVTVADDSSRSAGISRRWVTVGTPRWLSVRCEILMNEMEALRMNRGDTLTIAGNVSESSVQPATGDAIETITLKLDATNIQSR